MKFAANLTYDHVRFDQATDAHLVLSLSAPAIAWQEKRPRVCVLPVIDISGSMRGKKLEYAKMSVLKLIDHLTVDDYAGVVTFGSQSTVVAEPCKLEAGKRDAMKTAVNRLQCNGGTNFAAGLLDALRIVKDLDLSADTLTRVIMFTDGDANEGVASKPADLVRLLEKNMGRVTVSAFGYGEDVKQAFLTDFARIGKGNYAFVKEPDEALTAFGTELGGLLSTYGTNLVLEVEPQAGHTITQVVSNVESERDVTGLLRIRIPDILAEEERQVVLAVKFQPQKQAFPRMVNAFDASCSYELFDADGQKERKSLKAAGKVQFVKEGEEQKTPHKATDALVALAQLGRAQVEAEKKANLGDFKAAAKAMDFFVSEASARGHDHVSGLARGVRKRVGSHATYAASEGYRQSVAVGITRGMGSAKYDIAAVEELKLAGVVVSNDAREAYSTSFNSSDPALVVTPETPKID